MLEGDDLAQFPGDVSSGCPADARARLVRALRGAAEQRLRLDYSAVNRLALEDSRGTVRLAGVQAAIEDRSPQLLTKLLELVGVGPERRRASGRGRGPGAVHAARPSSTTWTPTPPLDCGRACRRLLPTRARRRGCATSALAALGYFSDVAIAEQLAAGFIDPDLAAGRGARDGPHAPTRAGRIG